jgi:hypothetical protein
MSPSEYFEKNPNKTINDYYLFMDQNGININNINDSNPQYQKFESSEKNNLNQEAIDNRVTVFYSNNKWQLYTTASGVISFFLPWYTFGAGNFVFIRVSGVDIAQDYPLLWLILLGLFFNIIMILANRKKFVFLRNLLIILPIVVFVVNIYNGLEQYLPFLGEEANSLTPLIGEFGKIFDFSFGFFIFLLSVIGVLLMPIKNSN